MDRWTIRIMFAGACGFLLLVIAGTRICTVTIREVRAELAGPRYRVEVIDGQQKRSERQIGNISVKRLVR